MKEATLCILLNDAQVPEVLLGLKKSNLGAGYYNFFGGKRKTGEDLEKCATRECYEECGVRVAPDSLKKKGVLTFHWPKQLSDWNQAVHVYIARKWTGEPIETEEMKPLWCPINKLPYEKMWAADRIWVPHVLQGRHVIGSFSYNNDKELIEKQIRLRDTISAKQVYRS